MFFVLNPLVFFAYFLGSLLRDCLLIVASLALVVWIKCFCLLDCFRAVFLKVPNSMLFLAFFPFHCWGLCVDGSFARSFSFFCSLLMTFCCVFFYVFYSGSIGVFLVFCDHCCRFFH